MIRVHNFDLSVVIKLEKVTLIFTHPVVFSVMAGCVSYPLNAGDHATGFVFSQLWVNSSVKIIWPQPRKFGRWTVRMLNTFIFFVVVAATVVSVLAAIALRKRRSTTAEMLSHGIELDPVIGGFVAALNQCASEADDRFVSALALLRQNPNSAAQQIEGTYRSIESQQFRVRESLLLTALALAHRSLLPLLVEVARQPVNGTARHDGGRALEESMLRMMAVDAIEAIALSGDTDAADELLALAVSPDRAVQVSAVVALKYAEVHRHHYEKLSGILPADRLYLLEIVRANVRDVPQIADPRRHLRSEPSTIDTRPDLATGARRNGGITSHQARAPKISNGG